MADDRIGLLRASMMSDPAVYGEVYQQLKARESSSRLELQASGSTELDELFDALTGGMVDVRPSMQLDALSDEEVSDEEPARMRLDVLLEEDELTLLDRGRLEAIVEEIGRPPLRINDDGWEQPAIQTLRDRLKTVEHQIKACLPAVGRIDSQSRMLGTGWLFDATHLITNAHVAERFVSQQSLPELKFTLDETAWFDLANAPQIKEPHAAEIVKLLTLRPDKLDVAVLEIRWSRQPNVTPLCFDDLELKENQDIAAIGYPDDDGRDDSFAMLRYFQNAFQVKRLSPGKILRCDDSRVFQHDCTTLGGSSGSPIIRQQSGKVVGIHFAGKTGSANLAIKSQVLQAALGL